ncbi:hypothetical protein O6H91_14G075900 [Diphasiastrum complanatum]|uniref:Uncharacterized protein n=1 Tax=Diphasiastrum complanatum TaxID=34168 RepID=A0ACC2BR78_DIPCM|nr:hypothetical protein O6H91_14G075900 [Diphasiastrum complanatum]
MEGSKRDKSGPERGSKVMKAFRLTNTSYTEIAQSLPLPNLPVSFGASNPELSLYEEVDITARLRETNESVSSQAGKIAELLRNTDVSYLSLKEEAKSSVTSYPTDKGILEKAVLDHDSEAFSCPLSGMQKRQQSILEESPFQTIAPPLQRIDSTNQIKSPQDPCSLVSAKKSRIRRKESHGKAAEAQRPVDAGELEDVLVNSLCELLEEIIERTDLHGDVEEDGTFLSLTEIHNIGEEVSKLRSKNSLHSVPLEHLVRLLGLLDHHIRRAQGTAVEEEDDVYSENYEIVLNALEAVQVALTVMTAPTMPKQMYKEEMIDRIVEVTRYQINHSVFAAYDALYRQLHKNVGGDAEDEEDEEDFEHEIDSSKKGKRKSKPVKAKKVSTIKTSSATANVFHKLCSILALLKDLLSVERLLDSTLLQLTRTILASFGIDNIQLLQLKATGVACTVFNLYPEHRIIIMDEVLSLFWKLPSSKRNLRTYHLPDDEHKQIQMFTALLLQIVQCSVRLPDLPVVRLEGGSEADNLQDNLDPKKCFEAAMDVVKYFWKNVLQRWVTPKSQDGSDIKAIVDNLVMDLLTTLNVPEFPAASLLLQVLCAFLLDSVGMKAKDAAVRGSATDLLGQIAAHLKQDALLNSRDTLWILHELRDSSTDPKGKSSSSFKEQCTICGSLKGSKIMIPCDVCHRWFHGDCIGVSGHDLLGRGWLCHCCLCHKQLSSLNSDLKTADNKRKSTDSLVNTKTEKGSEDNAYLKEGVAVLQQILLNYLQEAVMSDITATYARRFYLCLWYRYDNDAVSKLSFYHRRCDAKVPLQDFGIAPAPLSRDSIVRISRALEQQRPLARGFDIILERLLSSLQESSPTPRAKALKAVSAIVEVDPGVLGDERVHHAVEGRFLDAAVSVREAAMELVGRHIVCQPEVAMKYFEKIAERIMDTGVSVRKRVIKIIRDICLSKCGFAKATDACIRIISRINDEEASIQDLVCKTFFEMWFEEPLNQHVKFHGEGGTVPLEISERAQQLVDVLKGLPSHQPLVTIIKRSLALDFYTQGSKNFAPTIVTQAAVRNCCELMCKCLMESILKAEETTTENSEMRSLPYVLALHAFCTVDPTLCAPPSDPSRFAVTLQPYLKTQADTRDAAQLLQNIVSVIDAVIPLLRRPAQNFVEELDRDLRQLIIRYSFLSVVHACIKCLSSLGKVAVKGVTSLGVLVRHFFRVLDLWQKGQNGVFEKPTALRSLFCLGLLARYGAEVIDVMDDTEVNMQKILCLYKHYLRSEDYDVKVRALQALGFFFLARPQFMMDKDMGKLLEAALSSTSESRIKLQTLRNFQDYLLDVEKQMGLDEAGNDPANGDARELTKGVPVAAGAGDSNICGGIIQLHWDVILERCLDSDDQVRLAALKVVEIVLRQGLVHPITCVPHLIAMEVDQQELVLKLSHRLLVYMNEKYPSFVEHRLGDGLQLSFSFIQSGAAVSSKSGGSLKSKGDGNVAASAKAGICRIYRLIRGSRQARNKFLSSVVRKFDWVATSRAASGFLVYCAEILAYLPFTLPEEPLYLVYIINRLLLVRGGDLEANIKATISEGPLLAVTKQFYEIRAAEKEREGEAAYDFNIVEARKTTGEVVDDTSGIPSELLDRLRADTDAAAALALLLRLKRYLKLSYNLSDARCQAFQPNDTNKAETISRQSTRDFAYKDVPTGLSSTIRQMLEKYQAFKRLLKEDATDYSTYTSSITKKRARTTQSIASPGNPIETHQVNGHVETRTLRRKSGSTVSASRDVGSSGEDDDDDNDDDYEDWKGKKQKRSSLGTGRRKG